MAIGRTLVGSTNSRKAQSCEPQASHVASALVAHGSEDHSMGGESAMGLVMNLLALSQRVAV